MLGKKQYLASELVEKKAVIFVLVEEENSFIKQLIDFFQDCGLDVRILLLDAFLDPDQALKQYKKIKEAEIYKFLFIGGFKHSFVEETDLSLRVLQDVEAIFVEEDKMLPLFFLLNYSSPLSPINLRLSNYEIFWSKQKYFLNSVLKKFPLAQLCLFEDFIDSEFDLNLKFNLFFSLFKERLLFDSQSDCFWQTKVAFLENFKKIFFQSKPGEKFLIRGKKTQSSDFILKAQDLCARYFLENFKTLQLFHKSDKEKPLLADFIKIYHSSDLSVKVLDQKIRQLPLSLNKNFVLNQKDLEALKEHKTIVTPSLGADLQNEVNKPEKLTSKPSESKEALGLSQTKQTTLKNLEKNMEKMAGVYHKKTDKSSDIDKKLQEIFRSEQRERQEKRFDKNLKGAQKIVKKSKYRRLSFYFGVFLAGVGSLFLILFLNFYVTQKIFEKNLLATFQKSLESTSLNSFEGLNNRKYLLFKWQLVNYQKLFGDDFLSTPDSYWQIYGQVKLNQQLAEDLENQSFNLYQETLGTDNNPEVEWSNYLSKREEFYQHEQELSYLLDSLNPDILPDERAKILIKYKAQLTKELRMEQRALSFLQVFSDFILSPARTNIVVLIQDSNELRSSGGFLNSLLVLNFENGRLLNWQVQNVAELDQRIYGDKEASDELKNLLAADKLLLRDANWPVDFSESGADIDWFIEQSLNLKPDLILSVNSKELYTLSNLLFPMTINNFELNKNNFFEEMLRQENFNFDEFGEEFLSRLLKLSKTELNQFFRSLLVTIESRETLLYADNKELSAVLKNNLWSGELLDTPCPSDFASNEVCFTDGIYQLENNVGLNKVNRLIKQRINHSLGISENFIRHKRVMSFENFSRQNFWPEGNYQAYLKFYLPEAASLEKIALNGQDVDKNAYQWFMEEGKRVLSYRLLVPVLSDATLELVYLIPHELEAPFSYVFLDQKQPGIFDKETKYKVLFAESFQPNLIAPQASYENKVIEFDNNNQDNFLFAVAF